MTSRLTAAATLAAIASVAHWIPATRGAPALEIAADCDAWPNITASVTKIDCHGLEGILPAGLLENLPELTMVDLSESRLEGTLPTNLEALTALTWLDLSGNRLSGSLPASLGSLEALEMLDLNDNQLTGEIPAALGSIDTLKVLDLSENMLSGEIPVELAALPALTKLILSDNYLTGCVHDDFLGLCENEFGDFYNPTTPETDGTTCYFFSRICMDEASLPACSSNTTCTMSPTRSPTPAPTQKPTAPSSTAAGTDAPTFAPTVAPTYAPTEDTLNAAPGFGPSILLPAVVAASYLALCHM